MSRPSVRTALLAAAVAAVLGWFAWAQLPGRALLSPGTPATGEAEWIWLPGPATRRAAVAFYAVHDLSLETVPWAAELLVTADEEYIARVNGTRVGGGAFAPAAPLDRYHVASLLRAGTNRLVIEARSSRGAGGLLACLRDPVSGRVLAATGPDWHVLYRHSEELLAEPSGEAAAALGRAPHAISWGRPPTGRWGSPAPGPLRPAVSAAGKPVPPRWARPLGAPDRWRRLRRTTAIPPDLTHPSGVLLDFRRPVTGRLTLRLAEGTGQRHALTFFGLDETDPLAGEPEDLWRGGSGPRRPDGAVIALAGRHEWTDAEVRRFRFVAVLGVHPVADAWVEPAGPAEAVRERERASLAAGGRAGNEGRAGEAGPFGIEPPPLRSPVEDEVRRQLERLARGAGG